MGEIQLWLCWAILAIVLIISEIFLPGFFVFFFGVGAIPAAIAAALGASFVVQFAVFAVGSSIGLIFARKFALRLTKGSPENIGADRMLEKHGIVTEDLDPDSQKGKVRIDREIWIADTADGTALPVGTKVIVLRVEGTRLIVKQLDF